MVKSQGSDSLSQSIKNNNKKEETKCLCLVVIQGRGPFRLGVFAHASRLLGLAGLGRLLDRERPLVVHLGRRWCLPHTRPRRRLLDRERAR
jgi:hypothetical protein